MKHKNLIFIIGPTAVGKTKITIDICKHFNSEIISADSRQIYKELNIGVARPSKYELLQAKHHFIASHSIKKYYNASKYEFEVNKVIEKLFDKHDILFVTGGSGLYINALLFGIDKLPTIKPEIRNNLQNKFENEGIESIRFLLKKLDPDTYKKIDLKNHKRILKSLEVSIQTGKPYSTFLTGKVKNRNFKPVLFFLNRDRKILYQRINKRVDLMIKKGLINEVKNLYDYKNLTPLKTIGYREIFDYLDKKISLQKAVELIKRNSRRYAKKQITWFKRYKNAHQIMIDDNFKEQKIINLINNQ